MMNKTLRILLAAAALACLCSGCIRRTLRIESDPPGATVWVNGDNCGQTPAEMPFVSYGSVDIFLQKENHVTRREVVRLRAPWFAAFPVDFITDVLYPGTVHDRKLFGFRLQPFEQPDIEGLKARAAEFSESAKARLAREREKQGLPEPPRTAE